MLPIRKSMPTAALLFCRLRSLHLSVSPIVGQLRTMTAVRRLMDLTFCLESADEQPVANDDTYNLAYNTEIDY